MKSMVRILVIDDCSLVITALQRTLNSAGYKVIGTSSSQQAIEILHHERIDLVITDINMPERVPFLSQGETLGHLVTVIYEP